MGTSWAMLRLSCVSIWKCHLDDVSAPRLDVQGSCSRMKGSSLWLVLCVGSRTLDVNDTWWIWEKRALKCFVVLLRCTIKVHAACIQASMISFKPAESALGQMLGATPKATDRPSSSPKSSPKTAQSSPPAVRSSPKTVMPSPKTAKVGKASPPKAHPPMKVMKAHPPMKVMKATAIRASKKGKAAPVVKSASAVKTASMKSAAAKATQEALRPRNVSITMVHPTEVSAAPFV